MSGRSSKKHHQREVKLVRMKPYDNRITEYGKKGNFGKRIAMLSALFLVFVMLGGGYCFLQSDASENKARTSEMEAERLSEEVLGEPATVNTSDIVVLAEQEIQVPLVAIDAGHGGEDEGCSRDGVSESPVNLDLACRLSAKLQEYGFDTLLIREDNETFLTMEERVERANSAGADIYVSIHQNACEEVESPVDGIETWYYGESEGSWRLAQLIHKGAVEKTGASDREVRETEELYVIRETSMPSCLIETGFLSNRAEREAILTEEYQEKLAEGIAWGINYYFNPKTLYLTFDDGPSEDNTTAVLDILKERGIRATFFLVGENVQKHPEVARRIAEEGHTIGIHCYNHDYKELYKSVDSFLEDFQKAYDTIYEVTGVEVELFRFPGGSVNSYNQDIYQEIIQEMTDRGFIYFDWNASLEDAVKHSTPELLVQNGVNSTLGRKKVVMLAHDIIYNTTLCLEDLLDSLPEYEVAPLTPDVTPIQF